MNNKGGYYIYQQSKYSKVEVHEEQLHSDSGNHMLHPQSEDACYAESVRSNAEVK